MLSSLLYSPYVDHHHYSFSQYFDGLASVVVILALVFVAGVVLFKFLGFRQ